MRRLAILLAVATLGAQQDPRLHELERNLATRNFERAETLLVELTREHPRQASLHEQLGVLLLRKGSLGPAAAALETAIRLDARTIGARLALARVEWLRDEKESAAKMLAEAEALAADDARAQAAIAQFQREIGDGKGARGAFEKAIALAPDEPALRIALAELYLDHRTPEGALQTARAGLERFPQNPELLRLEALALYGLGDAQGAIDSLLRAARTDPASNLAMASFETLLADAGKRLPEVIEVLETYSIDAPESPVGPYLLALALAVQKPEEPRAAVMLREAVRRDPTFWPAWFELHRPLEHAGKTQEAIAALETAVALNPDYPASQFALSRLYARDGRRAEAAAARKKHHELMNARREAEEYRRTERPKLGVND